MVQSILSRVAYYLPGLAFAVGVLSFFGWMIVGFGVGMLIRPATATWHAIGKAMDSPPDAPDVEVEVNGWSKAGQALPLTFVVSVNGPPLKITSIDITFPPYWTENRAMYIASPPDWPSRITAQEDSEQRKFVVKLPSPPQELDGKTLQPIVRVTYQWAGGRIAGFYYPVTTMTPVVVPIELSFRSVADSEESRQSIMSNLPFIVVPTVSMSLVSITALLLFDRIAWIRSKVERPAELREGVFVVLVGATVFFLFMFVIAVLFVPPI